MIEAFYETVYAWLRAGAEVPREIKLRSRDYLHLAFDLSIDDPREPPRAVYKPVAHPLVLIEGASPDECSFDVVMIRVGKSFTFNGFGSPVVVSEAAE